MGASTAGVLSFKSISYRQNLVLAKMFWAYFPFIKGTTGLMAFQRLLLLEYGGGPEKDRDVSFWGGTFYARSPRIRLASRMSFGMMVTHLAWIAHRLASSNSRTRYASAAS